MTFGSAILDTAIGLVFVYLLLALIVSVINELIAQAVALRARTLEQGLRRLLDGRTSAKGQPTRTQLPDQDPYQPGGAPRDWVMRLYGHPLICAMSSTRGTDKPSYIPARTFALALLNLVAPNLTAPSGDDTPADKATYWNTLETAIKQIQEDQLRRALLALLSQTRGDVEAFRKSIETWFDESMERVSGWYKRKAQLITIVVALILAAALNADSVNIARTLWLDPSLRSSVASAAQAYVTSQPQPTPTSPTPTPSLGDKLKEVRDGVDKVESLGLPLGWTSLPQTWDTAALDILGIIVTTLAVSLGAPFWFDLLSHFVNFRSTGPPPPPGGGKPNGRMIRE